MKCLFQEVVFESQRVQKIDSKVLVVLVPVLVVVVVVGSCDGVCVCVFTSSSWVQLSSDQSLVCLLYIRDCTTHRYTRFIIAVAIMGSLDPYQPIQSPKLRVVSWNLNTSKYLSEEVIIHSNHHLTR